MFGHELRQAGNKQLARKKRLDGDAQGAGLLCFGMPDRYRVEVVKYRSHIIVERPPGSSQFQRSWCSLEQLEAEFGLEVFDLVADGRRRQEQHVGRFAETLAFGGDAEDTQRAQRYVAVCRSHIRSELHYPCQTG